MCWIIVMCNTIPGEAARVGKDKPEIGCSTTAGSVRSAAGRRVSPAPVAVAGSASPYVAPVDSAPRRP
jgi:hypothetical protein